MGKVLDLLNKLRHTGIRLIKRISHKGKEIRTTRDGKVKAVRVSPGSLDAGADCKQGGMV